MNNADTTKSFPLRTILTVTTGRLLTKPEGPCDNGIGQLYELLNWMTEDSLFTHQLGRAAEECKPTLLALHAPCIAACGTLDSLRSLDAWLSKMQDNTVEGFEQALGFWLAELKLMFPALRDAYDVPRLAVGAHSPKDPVAEMIELRESKEGIITVQLP